MSIEEDHLPEQIKGSYKKLVAEKANGGITDSGLSELLEMLAQKPGAVEILKQYTKGVEIRIDYKIS